MRTKLIEGWIASLSQSFGRVRPPVADTELLRLYQAQEYAGIVAEVKSTLHLDLRVRLGLVNSGGFRDAVAWIRLPNPMPRFGTNLFRTTTATLYLRKSFLAGAPFETVVSAIAHEFAHVVLDSTFHSLRRQEEAVDLTAMLLGYRDFYVTGCVHRGESKVFTYLSPEEISYAATFMTFRV